MTNVSRKRLNARLNEFFVDPDVQRAIDWVRDRNVFDIVSPDEYRMTRMLAWLLDPSQGHGLGDRFLKELLKAASIKGQGQFATKWPVHEIEWTSFHSAILRIEHPIAKDVKKRIDLLIYDYDNDLLIAIEHKFKAREGNGQTIGYFKQLDTFKAKHKVFIYLDYNAREAGDGWISLDYSWLQETLDRTVDRDALPQKVNLLLRDLTCYLAGEHELDPFYKGLSSLLAAIANRYRGLLASMKSELTASEQKLLWGLNSLGESDATKWALYKYTAFFKALEEYSHLEHLGELIKQAFANFPVDYYVSGKTLYLHEEQWAKFYRADYDEWAVYVSISEKSAEDGSPSFVVSANMAREGLLEQSSERIEEFASCFESSARHRRQGLLLFTAPASDESIAVAIAEKYMRQIDENIPVLTRSCAVE